MNIQPNLSRSIRPLYLLLIFMLAACFPTEQNGTGQQATPTPTETSVAITENPLADTSWMLTQIGSEETGSDMTLEFTAERISGFDGCNSFGSTYVVQNDNRIEATSPFASTLVGCPEDVMDAALRYTNALMTMGTFTFVEDRLTITSDAGDLVFVPPISAEIPDDLAHLVGKVWQWEQFEDTAGINSYTVADPENYTIEFMLDGQYELHSDCNRISGTYVLEGGGLTLQPGPSTLAYCGGDSLDSQFTSELAYVVSCVVSDGQLFLNLLYDSGNLIFSIAP